MSATTITQGPVEGPANDLPRVRMRVGFDLNAAGKRFATLVKQLAGERARDTGGLRSITVTLGPCPPGPIRERKITFYFVEVEGTHVEIAEMLRSMIPRDQVAPIQWSFVAREPNHIHVLATGIRSWVVCTGEAVPPVVILPPLTPTPAAGARSSEDADGSDDGKVVEFRRAA